MKHLVSSLFALREFCLQHDVKMPAAIEWQFATQREAFEFETTMKQELTPDLHGYVQGYVHERRGVSFVIVDVPVRITWISGN